MLIASGRPGRKPRRCAAEKNDSNSASRPVVVLTVLCPSTKELCTPPTAVATTFDDASQPWMVTGVIYRDLWWEIIDHNGNGLDTTRS